MEKTEKKSNRDARNLSLGCIVEWLSPEGHEKCFVVEKVANGLLGLCPEVVVTIRRLDESGQPIPDGEVHEVTAPVGKEGPLNLFAHAGMFRVPF